MNKEILINSGIDYDKGSARFLGDTALYETVLCMFLEDSSMARARTALADKDYKAMFDAMHELKGVSGNEDMTTLYKASCEVVELLRPGIYDEALIAAAFDKAELAYRTVIEGITLAKEN